MKALLCVQGINAKQGYLYDEIINPDGAGFFLTKTYDLIVDAKTDEIFNEAAAHEGLQKFKVSLVNFITIGNWSRFGDVWYYFKTKLAKERVSREVGSKIVELQKQGYEVSVIAHSLGNLITMSAFNVRKGYRERVRVDKFYSLANPIFIKSRSLRRGIPFVFEGVINYMCENICNFIAQKSLVLYSEHDVIASVFDTKAFSLVTRISKEPPFIDSTGTLHTVVDYLKFLRAIVD